MERPFDVTVDKLTITADIGHDFQEFMNDPVNPWIGKKSSCAFPYRYQWKNADTSLIQFGNETSTCKPIRFEWNPNNCNMEYVRKFLLRLKYPHLTRCDLAFDYNVDLSTFSVVDTKSRKTNCYRDGKGQLETLYIGATSSPLRIRIYNKSLEQEDDTGRVWWRVEAQIRTSLLDQTYDKHGKLSNPFDGLTLKQYDLESVEDLKKRAMLFYLLNEPAAMGGLSHPTRYKYKKLLANLAGSKELDLTDDFSFRKDKLLEKINGYMDLARRHDIVFYG